MSWPSRSTLPSTRTPVTVSCIRLRQRRKVDLPQPEGPIIAVTDRSRRLRETPRTACTRPKYASRPPTAMRGAAECSVSGVPSLARGEAASRGDTRGKADDEDDADEDEGGGPGLRVPLVVGTDRIGEDLQRKRRDRRPKRRRPELVA